LKFKETAMVKTAAERQARYRASRAFSGKDGEGQRRVNVWLSTGSTLALKRIAHRYGVTQQALIEKLLLAEDERILEELSVDSAEWNKYFGINTPLRHDMTLVESMTHSVRNQ
jgi:hypothetical protein